VRQNKSFSWLLPVDLALLLVGAYGIYVSTDWLVVWLSKIQTGFISRENMGLLSGWLMVLPNGLLAFYYGWRGNPEVVYTSQVGDGHISIPLSVGLYALYRPLQVPAFFQPGVVILLIAACLHFVFVAALGRLPRLVGLVLAMIYIFFLSKIIGH
jgi:cation:H+ antiporter